jgi:hypothetical protein
MGIMPKRVRLKRFIILKRNFLSDLSVFLPFYVVDLFPSCLTELILADETSNPDKLLATAARYITLNNLRST